MLLIVGGLAVFGCFEGGGFMAIGEVIGLWLPSGYEFDKVSPIDVVNFFPRGIDRAKE